MQYIDLDASNKSESSKRDGYATDFMPINLFQYDAKHVNHAQVLGIHVRGSSDKEVIDNNEVLQIFILHQDCMYCWTQSHKSK